ncbi:Homocysteine S-methyltransferase [Microthyrium microscopicum]|uniref:Homocysteine S-methyltransferase n=1 Tax=Microthyrium microscopicum TaxID=703497 RepID=A0A6A6USG1_9PEZI|nr:Homocysteine S-methyltransferase [Microthyrium microscopicum]
MNIEQYIKDHSSVTIDGALATELERRGCDLNCKLWSAKVLIENPEIISQVHLMYYQSASTLGLQDEGFTLGEAQSLIRKSVELANEAKKAMIVQDPTRYCFIAGSIGPHGAYLANGAEYTGEYSLSLDEMTNFHRPRMETLLESGVDLLACETIPSYQETEALLSLLEEYSDARAWFSFTLKDESHISDGTSLATVASLLETRPQVIAAGINCVRPDLVDGALETLSKKFTRTLIAYPNSGEDYDPSSKEWKGEATENLQLAQWVQNWHARGAKLIGGCCRTTPDDIKTIKEVLSPKA